MDGTQQNNPAIDVYLAFDNLMSVDYKLQHLSVDCDDSLSDALTSTFTVLLEEAISKVVSIKPGASAAMQAVQVFRDTATNVVKSLECQLGKNWKEVLNSLSDASISYDMDTHYQPFHLLLSLVTECNAIVCAD